MTDMSPVFESGIVSPDITLRQLVDAAEKLNTIDPGNAGSPELVGPWYVLRPGAADPALDPAAEKRRPAGNDHLTLLQQAGLVNAEITLAKLAEVATAPSNLNTAGAELVGPWFILRNRLDEGLDEAVRQG